MPADVFERASSEMACPDDRPALAGAGLQLNKSVHVRKQLAGVITTEIKLIVETLPEPALQLAFNYPSK